MFNQDHNQKKQRETMKTLITVLLIALWSSVAFAQSFIGKSCNSFCLASTGNLFTLTYCFSERNPDSKNGIINIRIFLFMLRNNMEKYR
jgi:hypothetical protein